MNNYTKRHLIYNNENKLPQITSQNQFNSYISNTSNTNYLLNNQKDCDNSENTKPRPWRNTVNVVNTGERNYESGICTIKASPKHTQKHIENTEQEYEASNAYYFSHNLAINRTRSSTNILSEIPQNI